MEQNNNSKSSCSDEDSFQSALEVPLEDVSNHNNNKKKDNDDGRIRNSEVETTVKKKQEVNGPSHVDVSTTNKISIGGEEVWIEDNDEIERVGSMYMVPDINWLVVGTNYGVGIYDTMNQRTVLSPSKNYSKSVSLAWYTHSTMLLSIVYTHDPRTLQHCHLQQQQQQQKQLLPISTQSYSHAILRVQSTSKDKVYVLLQNGTLFVHSSSSSSTESSHTIIKTLIDAKVESIRSLTQPHCCHIQGWLFDTCDDFLVCKYGPTKCQIYNNHDEHSDEVVVIQTLHTNTVIRMCISSSQDYLCTMDVQGCTCHIYHSLPHAIPCHTLQLHRGSKPCPIIPSLSFFSSSNIVVIWSSHGTIHFYPHWKQEMQKNKDNNKIIIKSKWKLSIPSSCGCISSSSNKDNEITIVTDNGTLHGYKLPSDQTTTTTATATTTTTLSSMFSSINTVPQPSRLENVFYYK